MPNSAKFGLALLTESQDSAEVTINAFIQKMEAFMGSLTIEQFALNTPPVSPSDGQSWVTGASPTGVWAGQANKIAFYLQGWFFFDPYSTGLNIAVSAFDRNAKEMINFSPVEDEWHPVQDRWSTTEHWTGKYDRAGNKIYSKTVNFGAMPNATTKTVAHGITTIDFSKFGRWDISAVDDANDVIHGNPSWILSAGLFEVDMFITSTVISMNTNWNASDIVCDVRIEYGKV